MDLRNRLLQGAVIPAHPLALTSDRRLDERHQRALTRYYLAAGAGGVAVGVHTTQFSIRNKEVGLLRPVLELASEEMRGREALKLAGVCGTLRQAEQEAALAAQCGYDLVLLSLAALRDQQIPALLDHARAIAEILPVMGFYLQPGVGGFVLPYAFWRDFAEIENVVAIKVAPFDRYRTIDVLRAVAESGRSKEIALYTGNDDHILLDLLSEFAFGNVRVKFAGGLLGQWAVWTKAAACQWERVRDCSGHVTPDLLTLAQELTDANAAIFDPAHGFRGCIPGIHEILRRQGLLKGRWCLDPNEDLSSGQAEEIDRVCRAYPHLQDNEFVQEHLDEWLA
jgi:hypothetical protein